MAYVTVPYPTYLAETLATLDDPGALLVTAGHAGTPNAMVIGWGVIGTIWGKPIFTVMVRPSRYSYTLLEENRAFTVCLPTPAQREIVDFCGSRSGRDVDKFRHLGLTPLPSLHVPVPGIEGCPVIYECRAVHCNDVVPAELAPDIQRDFYARGDYHRVYYGEILAVRGLQVPDGPSV